jgi:hypothetical protein
MVNTPEFCEICGYQQLEGEYETVLLESYKKVGPWAGLHSCPAVLEAVEHSFLVLRIADAEVISSFWPNFCRIFKILIHSQSGRLFCAKPKEMEF